MSATSTANRTLFWVVVPWLALAPVPVASNRPFFWALNAMVAAASALLYAMIVWRAPPRLRMPLRAVTPLAFLYAATLIWLVVQVVPLPWPRVVSPAWQQAADALGQPLAGSISVDRAATIGMILRLGAYGILFFVVGQFTVNPDRARRLLKAVFWIIVIHGAAAILMLLVLGDTFLFVFPKWAYLGDATGFFINRNSFATFAAIGIAVGTVLAIDDYAFASGNSKTRSGAFFELVRIATTYGTGLVILTTAVLLSASRMGAFVAVAGVLVAFVLGFIRSGEHRGALVLVFVAVAALAVVVLAFSGGAVTERIGSLETSADDRLTLYRQVLGMIRTRPWTGYGGGTFSIAFPSFHRLPLSADVTWDAAHDTYLELFSDLGFGAVLPLLAFVLLFLRIARSIGNSRVSWPAPAAALAVMIIAAIHSLVDFSLQIEANALIFTAIVAAGSAQAWRAARNSRDADRHAVGAA